MNQGDIVQTSSRFVNDENKDGTDDESDVKDNDHLALNAVLFAPIGQEPLYERRADLLNKMPFGSRLGGGEIRQVMGTPPVNRHR